MDLLARLATRPEVRDVGEALRAGKRVIARGSQGSSGSFTAAAIGRQCESAVLLVVAHVDDADEAVDELCSAGVDAARIPALEVLPGESSISIDLFAERLAVIRRLAQAAPTSPRVLIAPIQALMQPAPARQSLARLALELRAGERRSLTDVVRWLQDAGYTRLDAIEEAGDFSVRGGIVDVFPPGGGVVGGAAAHPPVRLDFFGDELERISEIDLDTMGSDRRLDSVEIICASLEQSLGPPSSSREGDREGAVDAIGGSSGVSILDYIPRQTVVVLHETMEIVEQGRGYFERVTDGRIFGPPAVIKTLQDRFAASPGGAGRSTEPGVRGIVELNQFSTALSPGDCVVELPVSPLHALPEDAGEAVKELAATAAGGSGRAAGGAEVCVFCQNAAEQSRLHELIREFAPDARDTISSAVRYIHRGFVWAGANRGKGGEDQPRDLMVVPYHELLHRFERRGGRGRASRGTSAAGEGVKLRAGRAMDAFLGFGVGEYVVHRDHGIALFQGLTVMKPREVKRAEKVVLPSERGGGAPPLRTAKPGARSKAASAPSVEQDPDAGLEEFLTLEFAGRTKLHVPATKIDQVQKYVGGLGGKSAPTLSALGGTRWSKQKESVAESVKDLAGEMLRIRAAREHMPGIRFPDDTAWQKEFEAEFPYQETDDQLAALAEIKKDMLSGRPMDRLLCGDVGYGKTELAIRAAFKAVEFGKQVAVLVPTTVLAEQHERTFKSRFADYPFRIESLSRFKSDKEVNDVLAAVRKGQVDIVIGTHRLLSKDVRFADLGVVVIDEEQRFGVEHKERLLSLRMTVDVLTLSATPIPRTLHMSMLGLRDISSLTTAPVDRRAVVTEVIPYNARRIQQAIQRELVRDGQVFFVHNRVHNIQTVADEIQKLAPQARLAYGHGQMPDRDLEKVMLAFMRGEIDILVSTTIIESGIDIPTANTMFINDADRFGLAELHQLRGRVGRYKNRAYCYMLLGYSKGKDGGDKPITEKAMKRLKAIEEFNMLGAGFKIAMRDLEIRGAGNILGPEQSGHIAAVGYEMYCQLLDRAVKELKNEPTQVASETSIELGVTGMIPKRYIASDQRRMEAYRRIAVAQSPEELVRITEELKQAYGDDLPQAAQRLLGLAELRVLASRVKLRSIAVRGPDVILRAMPPDAAAVGVLLHDGGVSHVTVLPPKTGEETSEVYLRPPSTWMDGETILGVLRRRLGGGGAAGSTGEPAPANRRSHSTVPGN